MRFKSTVKSYTGARAVFGIAFACLAVMCVSPAAAQQKGKAQPVPMPSPGIAIPVSDWTVGPVSVKPKSPPTYCSMRNRFDNKMELIFAHDPTDAYSVALDFGQRLLEEGREYDVALTVPPDISRSIIGVAVSKDIMVLQLGYDRPFMDQIRRRSRFDARMDGFAVSFSLNGTGKALDALTNCTQKLAETGIAETQTFEAPKDLPAEDMKTADLQGEVDRLKAELETLKQSTGPVMPAAPATPVAQTALPSTQAAVIEGKTETVAAPIKKPDMASDTGVQPDNVPPSEIIQPNMPATSAPAVTQTAAVQPAVTAAAAPRTAGGTTVAPPPAVTRAPQSQPAPAPATSQPVQFQHPAGLPAHAPAAAQAAPVTFAGTPAIRRADFIAALGIPYALTVTDAARDYKVYSWSGAGGIYGAAHFMPRAADKTFVDLVTAYRDSVRGRCAGDFAFKGGEVLTHGGYVFQVAETACITKDMQAGAGIVFVSDARQFVVITHEAAVANLVAALNARDGTMGALERYVVANPGFAFAD